MIKVADVIRYEWMNTNNAMLLEELRKLERPFDASTINAVTVTHEGRELFKALGFLNPRRVKRNGYLSEHTLARIRRWFDEVEDRDIAGLRLVRDALGWCRVVNTL